MTLFKTADNNFGTAALIVDPVAGQGTHTTIAAALTDASSGQTIFIRPGTFTENLTLKAGVNLCGFSCDGFTPNVTIKGKTTGSFSGRGACSGIRFETNADYLFESTGSNSINLTFINCFFNCTDFSAFHITNSNASINANDCQGNLNTTGINWFNISAGAFAGRFCLFFNTGNSNLVDSISGGNLGLLWCHLRTGVNTTGTGNFTPNYCTILPPSNVIPYQQDSSATSIFTMCDIGATTTEAIQINSGAVRVWNCRIEGNGTYNISGTGTLTFDHFDGGNSTVSLDPGLTLTQRRMYAGSIQLGKNVQILSGSGSPNGAVTGLKGSLFLRTDGSSTSTRAYINTNSGTSWTAITTAS